MICISEVDELVYNWEQRWVVEQLYIATLQVNISLEHTEPKYSLHIYKIRDKLQLSSSEYPCFILGQCWHSPLLPGCCDLLQL